MSVAGDDPDAALPLTWHESGYWILEQPSGPVVDIAIPDPPCKHEWRQWFDSEPVWLDPDVVGDPMRHVNAFRARGFFCIHCKKRDD